jgi:hypothetical protein
MVPWCCVFTLTLAARATGDSARGPAVVDQVVHELMGPRAWRVADDVLAGPEDPPLQGLESDVVRLVLPTARAVSPDHVRQLHLCGRVQPLTQLEE